MTKEDKRHLISSIYFPSLYVVFLWLVKSIEIRFDLHLAQFGIFPGSWKGLIGVLFSPLLHVDINHLLANSGPVFLLLSGLFYLYRKVSFYTIFCIYLGSGVGVWFFGRMAYHIGASGLIYGLLSFIFFSGIFRRDRRSIALSLLVTFLYGSMIWGVFPIKEQMSYEAHLSGAIIGIVLAFLFRKIDLPPKETDEEELVPEWEEEIWGTYSN